MSDKILWPTDLDERLSELAEDKHDLARREDQLIADCGPALWTLVERHCLKAGRSDLVGTAFRFVLLDFLRAVTSSAAHSARHPRVYLQVLVGIAVNRCIAGQGSTPPAFAQDRQDRIERNFGAFVAENGRAPTEAELLRRPGSR